MSRPSSKSVAKMGKNLNNWCVSEGTAGTAWFQGYASWTTGQQMSFCWPDIIHSPPWVIKKNHNLCVLSRALQRNDEDFLWLANAQFFRMLKIHIFAFQINLLATRLRLCCTCSSMGPCAKGCHFDTSWGWHLLPLLLRKLPHPQFLNNFPETAHAKKKKTTNLLTHTHRFFPNVGKIMKKCTGFACHYLGGSSYAGGSRMAPQWKLETNWEIHLGSSSPFWIFLKRYVLDKIWKKNSKVHTLHQKINGTLPTDPQVSYQSY